MVSALCDLRNLDDKAAGDLEKSLVALLTQDPENVVARGRLRLIRICKTLCQDGMNVVFAVVFIMNRSLNTILYSIFGADGHERIDLAAFLLPGTSPVVRAQAFCAQILNHWSRDNPQLQMLVLLGADFSNRELRIRMRAHTLKADSGLNTYFVVRMSKPPYSCACICYPDSYPASWLDEKLQEFYETPFACLPLLCRRWRKKFPTRTAFQRDAVSSVWSFLQSVALAIDWNERSHRRMRSDLWSSGAPKECVGATPFHVPTDQRGA